MNCTAKDCTAEAVCFYKGFGRAKAPRCAAHRDAKIPHFPIALFDTLNSEIRPEQALPPPEVPKHSKPSSGWGELPQRSVDIVFESSSVSVRRVQFAHWHLEDMIYPGHTSVVVNGEPFESWLRALPCARELSVYRRSLESLSWNRDPVLRTLSGPSLFMERELPKNQRFTDLPKCYQDAAVEHAAILGGVRQPKDAIAELCKPDLPEPAAFGIHHEPLAGGNVITAYNRRGQLRFIVGEVAVYSTFKLCECTTVEEAQQQITRVLLGGAEQTTDVAVLFVPQWAYHIDLQLLYLGPGRVAMHCFQKQHDLVNDFYVKPSSSSERSALHTRIATLRTQAQPMQDGMEELLSDAGFDVIRVAGCFPTKLESGHVCKTDSPYEPLYFCFLNGIALHPDRVLVGHNEQTKSQFVEFAFIEFQEALQAHDIQAIPVGNHLTKRGGTDVSAYGLKEGGGLRCRTTTLPKAFVDRLP